LEYSVLIIDDDIWMQRILSKTLQSYGFKNVYLASNGFEGLDLAVEHHPSLIIMDILMPDLSGHLTLKILKNIKLTKPIPVLMVSALSDTENLGMAVKMGTAGFISKPFTRATVYEKLITIFGKERLDQIAKGEAFDTDFNYQQPNYVRQEDKVFIPMDSFANLNPFDDVMVQNNSELSGPTATPTIPLTNAKAIRNYKEDEKRSIESIKKLLMKSRK